MKKDYEKPNLWILMFEKNGIFTETVYDSLWESNNPPIADDGEFDDFLGQ